MYSGYRAETGQVRQGFSTHPHLKSGEAGAEAGGLSVHQAHWADRSTQTGEVRICSLQSKDLVHTGSKYGALLPVCGI